jgi:tetratricopeptide (TPR) repeat protein
MATQRLARATGMLLVTALWACAQDETASAVPLYDNLGDHHYEVTTVVPLAQSYFDQGLRLYYAFNHEEGIRAFREAQRLDPNCAMCFWGEALAWGPNINLPMDASAGIAAYEARQKALSVREHASPREQAFIDALALRYAPEPPDDRGDLDLEYSDAMAGVAARYPDDHEAQVLYAESLMDLRPWDYWTEAGDPQPGIADALSSLQRVIDADERHPGGCHFFIHAVEKLYPDRAVECAERLANLMPGAGHLVHMPGHIYVRVGRYRDAVAANEHAVHADETYISDQMPGMGMYTAGYYPHNYDFMAFAAMMIGRSATAIESAEKVSTLIPEEMFGAPGMDFLQHWTIRPLLVRIRFARWDELLDVPAPPESQPHARAIWHYARGRALAATGDASGAAEELGELRTIMAGQGVSGLKMEYNQSADLLAIAERILSGWIDVAAGRFDSAVVSLEEAVRREDALLYGEPPEWTVPTRQDLGAVLLLAERPVEAEAVFREELAKFRDNGWSLAGLASALQAQGRVEEAEEVEVHFQRVWETADVGMPRQ